MKLVIGKRNLPLSVMSFLISYPQLSRSSWCLREIHTEMSRYIYCITLKVPYYGSGWDVCYIFFYISRSPKLKLRRCLFKWLKLSWRWRSKLLHTKVNSKGSHIFSGTSRCFVTIFLRDWTIRSLHEVSNFDSDLSDMKEDVVYHLTLMPHTATLWVMLLVYCFIVGKLDWYPRFVLLLVLIDEYVNVSMCLCFVGLQVGNLAAPVAEWTVGGTALTSLMDVERRHGKPLFSRLRKSLILSLVIQRAHIACHPCFSIFSTARLNKQIY